ncbi:proteinase inhibitor I4, serpin [Lunatimonas lonarensis]|uniref:Proteinase inhibitor I4, serpin n=2 Tax=Lunatimonas lonarensis TaxID=1232681 RepID=R7ZY80_9BACT|nr:proteinase inhibitor I4, serpin [Lunatimonas lonarensis]
MPNIRTLQAYERQMVDASSLFALDLFRELQEDDLSNQFFSPYSIHQALSMAMNGNRDEILREYLDVLRFGDMSLANANRAAKELTEFLLQVDPKVRMSIANAIWFREGLRLNTSFRDQLATYYAAEIASLNMGSPQAKDIINQWIENKTNGIIKGMLDYVPADAVMYLVNAIYFKGDWKYQFPARNTTKASFQLNQTSQVEVDMMSLDTGAEILFFQDGDVTYLEIPYSTGQYSMGVLVSEDFSLGNLASNLTLEQLESFRSSAFPRAIQLSFPKFKMRQKQEELVNALSGMGLTTPFTSHPDNFSELFEGLSGNLQLSRVIHDAFIEVDEKGTEAAAATIAEVVLTSLPTGPVTYRVDKPFMFFIQEAHSGAILFMGKIADPSKDS